MIENSDVAPTKPNLPDFIIGGAPECGTNSLHSLLDQHPNIAVQRDKINYYDADDPVIWPDFFQMQKGDLKWLAPNGTDLDTRAWFELQFQDLGGKMLRGEDSINYLFSPMVPYRVARELPDVKVIFMLRDPVERAHAQYWQDVKMMRATTSFEKAITRMPTLVSGSTYAQHLRTWWHAIGPDRIKIVLMEDFLANMQSEMDGIAAFLGAEPFEVSNNIEKRDPTYYPTWTRGQLALNWMVGQHVARMRYQVHMRAHIPEHWSRRDRLFNKIYQKWFHKVNPILLRSTKAPMMKDRTRQFLSAHLSARNSGLEEILGRDLSSVWPNWDKNAANGG